MSDESKSTLIIKKGGNGMGELYAGFVLEGRITSYDAIYIFYYRFPIYADSLTLTMNNVFLIEGRKDLVKTYDQIEEIKKLAETNRQKYIEAATGVKTTTAVETKTAQ